MRRPPLAPVVLLVAVAGWVITCDWPGCQATWSDLSAFSQTVFHGKMDKAAGQKVLGDIGSVFQDSFAHSAKTLHLHVGTVAKNTEMDSAVVLIKGDVAEGTGFLVQMPDGPVVVTNLHVISGNPHFHVLTNDGREIPILLLKGASDRDVALLGIQDDHYHYLELAKDAAAAAQQGDDVVTPGDSEGGEVTLDTPGVVNGVGPERIEISNPIFHGNSGGPVVDLGSGQVVGVVTFATTRGPTDAMDQASRANPNSAITSDVRYFALRMDNVPDWEPYAMDEFVLQTKFLANFHENSLCLDSILNGARYEKTGQTAKGAPDSKYYLHNRELEAEIEPHLIDDPDHAALVEDVRVAVLDCQRFAQRDMDSIQNPRNFYSFEWKRAQEEVAYRKVLLKELQAVNDKIN